MTYASLVALLQDYTENSETSFVANIPEIVKQGESFIYGQVRTPDQRSTATSTFGVGVNTITINAIGVEPISLTHSNGTPILLKDESFIRVV